MKYRVLEVIEFSSDRKRMTAFVQRINSRDQLEGEIIILSKGADDVMLSRISSSTSPDLVATTKEHLSEFSKRGLRTLVFGCRRIAPVVFQDWARRWEEVELKNIAGEGDAAAAELAEEMERDFTLLGATAVDDRLQENAAETIARLKLANIAVWVLTGDKQETAVSIGHACQLLSQKQDIFFVNDPTDDGDNVASILTRALEKRDILPTADPIQLSEKHDPTAKPYAIVIDGKTLQSVFKTEENKSLFITLAAGAEAVVG